MNRLMTEWISVWHFRRWTRFFAFWLGLASAATPLQADLPFESVFKGVDRFEVLKEKALRNQWTELPIGERTAEVGTALLGTPYVNYTLEIHDSIEAPSVNFEGMDCWTFFEISLAFARMLNHPQSEWTPEKLLHYIELDRYRGGICDGSYLSRLHYLEDWAWDNERRGLVRDMARELGGVRAPVRAREMTILWKSYRYLRNNPALIPEMKKHEARIERLPTYYIPLSKVKEIEPKLKDGDIIGIWSQNTSNTLSTTHVGLAIRDRNGTLRFMHATTQKQYGRTVALDSRLSEYLNRFSKHRGIMVARPLK